MNVGFNIYMLRETKCNECLQEDFINMRDILINYKLTPLYRRDIEITHNYNLLNNAYECCDKNA